MDYSIKNDFLKVSINQKGAELSSIFNQKNQTEYLWQADSAVWGRHAPVLFPIVGQVKDGFYTYDGKNYQMSQHGFARDREFEVLAEKEDSISFQLQFDKEGLKIYPFKFSLKIEYKLVENKLLMNYSVENLSDDDMYFQLGLHPGFQCPIDDRLSFDDYYLEFNKPENLDRMLLEGPLLSDRVEENFVDGRQIKLNHELFDDDALIFEEFNSTSITLKSDKDDKSLEMGIEGFPLLGIWSKPGASAPYVCIEPWYGVADHVNGQQSYKEKKAIQFLSGKAIFEASSYVRVV